MISGTILQERYQIEDVIGSGGFATTYRGIDLHTQETIAIKECKNLQPKGMEKIRQEAQVMRDLSDCNGIVNIRDYIELEASAYIIMDYIDGITLKAYVEQHAPMNMKKAIGLLKPVMESVSMIHERGLLHRDISPDNLMLQPDGTLKLLDFGAAKNAADEDEKTMTMVLKPGYAPEEQYRSLSAQGTWTDVYALCATLYFCITGFAPTDSLQRMYEDTLKKPSELGASIESCQEETLMHGLALRCENRIATVADLLMMFDMRSMTRVGSNQVQNDNSFSEHAPKRKKTRQINESEQIKPSPKRKAESSQMKPGMKLSGPVAVSLIAVVLLMVIVIAVFAGRNQSDGSSSDEAYVYINDQTVTDADVSAYQKNEKLQTLSFSGCELSDEVIQGLAEISQLERISFSDCEGFTDLNPLADLEQLYGVSYYVNDIDAKPFDGNQLFSVDFPYVTDLVITLNAFENGEAFFVRFPNVETLFLYAAWNEEEEPVPLESLDFTRHMKSLTSLQLQDIELLSDDISVLGEQEQLYSLQLENAGITNLNGLEQCTELSYLEVPENNLTSLLPLSEHTTLRDVDVTSNQLTSLEGLEKSKDMRLLYAGNNQITDISVLEDKEAITTLDLSDNQLQSLHGCERMIHLTEIDVNCNQITDLQGIVNSTSLTSLKARENQIKSLEPLRDRFSELQIVDVADNELTDIAMLSCCNGLQLFRGDNNQLRSLSGLEEKAELYAVSACGNQLTDIEPLRGLPKLQYVDIAHNMVTDLSPLSTLAADDTVLFLEDNKIVDISALPLECTYRMVSVYSNPLEDYHTAVKLLTERIYLPDIKGMAYEELKEAHTDYMKLIDVEIGKQAQVERFFADTDFYVSLLSVEEAEEEMQSTRDYLVF